MRKWIFLSAAFGDSSIIEAGSRIEKQAISLGIFDRVIVYKSEDLKSKAPSVSRRYSEYLNSHHKGFGYFCWKPELVYRTLLAYPEHGLVWADAGCEINSNFLARWRLKQMMRRTISMGHFFYKLDYPEYQYTKRELFFEFPSISFPDLTTQIQATWFLLYGPQSRNLAKHWFDISLKNIRNLDLETRYPYSGLIEHRFDQSVLSLVCKESSISANRYLPVSVPTSFLARLRAISHPIWSSRNRSGVPLKRNVRFRD